jgi:hypothetical protein
MVQRWLGHARISTTAIYGVLSDVERECLEAIYAHEEILSIKNGKKTPASRTWPMVMC